MKTRIILLASLLLGTAAFAGPRTSANYHIASDIADTAGKRTTSATYTNDASMGDIGGTGDAASATNAPAGATAPETAKSGYIGQLYDITGLIVNAISPSVNETGTLQLAAWQFLDDASLVAVPATTVAWGVAGGPLTSISATGLATAGNVYQNTPASAQGSVGGFTGTLNLTVLDTIPDNFGSYAGDGVGDDWQVQYFGQNNPSAGPNVDFSHTGQTNLFKYVAGLNPIDRTAPNAVFSLSITSVPGQPGQKNLIFSPIVAGRTYVVKEASNLTAPRWNTVNVSAPRDSGTTRTVTDLTAGNQTKYYHIEITKP